MFNEDQKKIIQSIKPGEATNILKITFSAHNGIVFIFKQKKFWYRHIEVIGKTSKVINECYCEYTKDDLENEIHKIIIQEELQLCSVSSVWTN